VSSFLSQWSHSPSSPVDASSPQQEANVVPNKLDDSASQQTFVNTPLSSSANLHDFSNQTSPSPNTAQRTRAASGSRPSSRPASMVQTYQPPLMEVANDTPPELQPIFTFLNSHSNKLYQEGYFLKLHDLDGRGRPSANRTWQECFAVCILGRMYGCVANYCSNWLGQYCHYGMQQNWMVQAKMERSHLHSLTWLMHR
jgi:CCR4-NOT transcriptional complex subunit CAF120